MKIVFLGDRKMSAVSIVFMIWKKLFLINLVKLWQIQLEEDFFPYPFSYSRYVSKRQQLNQFLIF